MLAQGATVLQAAVVYGGEERQQRLGGDVLGWRSAADWASGVSGRSSKHFT